MEENYTNYNAIIAGYKNTPDIATLERYEAHLMLDCGPITRPMLALCSAYTHERLSLYIRQEDNMAVPVRIDGRHRARVYGAIYKVSTEKLVELDKWKENGVVFERKAIDVLVPYADVENNTNVQKLPAKVWFYQAKRNHWQEPIQVDDMRWSPNFKLAKTYRADEPEFNNHFRFADKTLDIHRVVPTESKITPAVVAHIKKRNAEFIHPTYRQAIAGDRDAAFEYCQKKEIRRQLKEATIRNRHEKQGGFYELRPSDE